MLREPADSSVIDPPSVSSFSPQYPVELTDFSAACTVVPGNPPNTEMYWTRSGEETFQQNSTHLRLFSINRNDSGTYKCTAENTYSSGSKGSNSQTLVVDVQCKFEDFQNSRSNR